MTIPSADHPWKKERRAYFSIMDENIAENELESTIGLVCLAQKTRGIKVLNGNYTTRLDVYELARQYQKNWGEVEQEIETLWEKGYLEISEGRFLRLTEKASEIVDLTKDLKI
jgi:hypothetical protein